MVCGLLQEEVNAQIESMTTVNQIFIFFFTSYDDIKKFTHGTELCQTSFKLTDSQPLSLLTDFMTITLIDSTAVCYAYPCSMKLIVYSSS